jgi:hypothetical protein
MHTWLDARSRVAVVGILHRDADDRLGLEADRMAIGKSVVVTTPAAADRECVCPSP